MYYAKVNWYDKYKDEDEINHLIVCATDWNDAMRKVSGEFEYINSIEMKQIQYDSCNVVYIKEDMLKGIIEENGYE